MIRFKGKLVLLDKDNRETSYYYNKVNAESPEEAALSIFKREDPLLHRKPMIGDCVIISRPEINFDKYFIFDKDGTVKNVSIDEFNRWRLNIHTDPFFIS